MSGRMSKKTEAVSNPEWTNLPRDLLHSILTLLVSLSDYCHFGAVCQSWYSVAEDDRPNRMVVKNDQLPLLLVPHKAYGITTHILYDAVTNTQLYTTMPVNYTRRICGSAHGWLITVNLMTSSFTLINPFSGRSILLPVLMENAVFTDEDEPESYSDFRSWSGSESGYGPKDCNGDGYENRDEEDRDLYNEYFIFKAVLSADPNCSDNFAVMVIFGSSYRLAFYVSGNENWTIMDREDKGFDDIMFTRGMFYIVDHSALLYSCQIDDPTLKQVADLPSQGDGFDSRKYIMESPKGDILQIWRFFEDDPSYVTLGFVILRLLEETRESKPTWEFIDSLDGASLFLGDNHGISVMACNYRGCQPDSIYFTMESELRGKPNLTCDIGVFSLENKRVYNIYEPERDQEYSPPPIWIIPSLGGNDRKAIDI